MPKQTSSTKGFFFVSDENLNPRAVEGLGVGQYSIGPKKMKGALDRDIVDYVQKEEFKEEFKKKCKTKGMNKSEINALDNSIGVIVTGDHDYAVFSVIHGIPAIYVPQSIPSEKKADEIRKVLSVDRNARILENGGYVRVVDSKNTDIEKAVEVDDFTQVQIEESRKEYTKLFLHEGNGFKEDYLKEYWGDESKEFQELSGRIRERRRRWSNLVKAFHTRLKSTKRRMVEGGKISQLSNNRAFERSQNERQRVVTYHPELLRQPRDESLWDGKGVEIIYPCKNKNFRVDKKAVLYDTLEFDIVGCKGRGTHYGGGRCIGRGKIIGTKAQKSKISGKKIILETDVGECSGTLIPLPKSPPVPPIACSCKVEFTK